MKKITISFGAGLMAVTLLASPVSAQIGGTVNVDIGAEERLESNTSVEVGVTNEATTTSTTSHSDVSAGAGILVTSAAQVNSKADLEKFSVGIVSENEAVSDVNINTEDETETKVEVVYKHKGRLFWIFPVTLKSTTVVEVNENAETRVSSRLPWWSFLVAGENFNKADLESKIKSNATVKAQAKANASAHARAQVAEAVIAELQSQAEVEAGTEVTSDIE